MIRVIKTFSSVLCCLSFLASCSDSTEPRQKPIDNPVQLTDDLETINRHFWAQMQADTQSVSESIDLLVKETDAFLKQTTASNLLKAQQHWHEAEKKTHHLVLLKLISDSSPEPLLIFRQLYFRLFAKPIQPGFLDRIGDYAFSGLVYDIGFPLSEKSLQQQHGLTSDEELVLGLYAIEFMLFGESHSRSVHDYEAQTALNQANLKHGLQSIDEIPNNRRRRLLALQTQMLHRDTQRLIKFFAPDSKNSLQESWLTLPPEQQIQTVRFAVSVVLTNTLVDISLLQTLMTQGEPISDPPQPTNDQTPERLARQTAKQLNALLPALNFFSNAEKPAFEHAIHFAASSLTNLNTDASHQRENTATLEQIYAQLKPLL